MITSGELDILAIGEILVDFISGDVCEDLSSAFTYHRFIGGSPVNIAINGARLGGRTGVIARAGTDFLGDYLEGELKACGVDTTGLSRDPTANTSIIFVSRTCGTPCYEAFRNSDYQLSPDMIDADMIRKTRLVHSSAFALSREPLRSSVLKVFRLAREMGLTVSFDPNYREKIWPDRHEAMRIIQEAYSYADITKPSLDDAVNIFGPGLSPSEYASRFARMGPSTVVLTMGEKGALLCRDELPTVMIPARRVDVQDVTGAGDAFWAAFLMGHLDGLGGEDGVLFAREIVAMKLSRIGPLPESIDRESLYSQIPRFREEVRATI